MHTKRNLIASALVIGTFFFIHFNVVGSLHIIESVLSPKVQLPDFSAIDNVSIRKRSFFDYLTPMIEEENQRLLALRKSLPKKSEQELKSLADLYGLNPEADNLTEKLRKRIDAIPVSLVLAQAAMESAWGTSRFAMKGNNLFGQWCYKEGCGMIPKHRNSGAKHEVRSFHSPRDSIRSYLHNLNSHRAYAKLRAQRASLRNDSEKLSGCYLAEGLESYSEKGLAYVESIKKLIRSNQLEVNSHGHCSARVIAEPEEEKPAEKSEDATDAA